MSTHVPNFENKTSNMFIQSILYLTTKQYVLGHTYTKSEETKRDPEETKSVTEETKRGPEDDRAKPSKKQRAKEQ